VERLTVDDNSDWFGHDAMISLAVNLGALKDRSVRHR